MPLFCLTKAFRNLQVKNSELEERVRKQDAENTELKAQIRAEKKEKTRSKKEQRKAKLKAKADAALGIVDSSASAEPAEPEENEPFLMGKKFLIAGAMWVESFPKLFQPPLAPPPFAFDDVARYDRSLPNRRLLGHLADLYHVVPARLHKQMASPVEFQTEVRANCLIVGML